MVRWKDSLLLTSALIVLSLPAFGQSAAATAQVRGAVKDPVQAAVSGARVTLTEQRTQARTTVVSDSQGAYIFSSVQPGTYVVEVEEQGFKNTLSPPLKVEAGATVMFDASLVLAEVGQS